MVHSVSRNSKWAFLYRVYPPSLKLYTYNTKNNCFIFLVLNVNSNFWLSFLIITFFYTFWHRQSSSSADVSDSRAVSDELYKKFLFFSAIVGARVLLISLRVENCSLCYFCIELKRWPLLLTKTLSLERILYHVVHRVALSEWFEIMRPSKTSRLPKKIIKHCR